MAGNTRHSPRIPGAVSLIDQRKIVMGKTKTKTLRVTTLETSSGLAPTVVNGIPAALTALLADFFALYVKTKNFHWHVSGPHFRDHHLLLDEQATQTFDTTDAIAERARMVGRRHHNPFHRPHRRLVFEVTAQIAVAIFFLVDGPSAKPSTAF